MLRYYFDENMDGRIAEQLRKREIDVLRAEDVGRAGHALPDHDQFAYAASLGRVIVTRDADFSVLAHQQLPHAGVVWLPKPDSIGRYTEFLEYLALTSGPEDVANRLIYYDW